MGSMKVFLATLVTLAVSFSVNACPLADQAVLLAFKAALNEPYLSIFSSWPGNDCCSNWYGVSCDPTTGRVADIVLRGELRTPFLKKPTGQAIFGEIPACISSSLPILRIFDLVGNQISGKIPADIGSLGWLTILNLTDNKLTGGIPPSIVNLGSLMHLDLSNNKLAGEIP
ncbi:hypothetical protein ACH5RR_023433 [Cinchona calisaya]|uniref:Leucine-rich repeat-containing N-terminal plant-type domain-containing protein n=1 Tax=Cinchona calisaya TaxID=153742 RepID=A0ABD2ZAM6_9GENT